MEKSLYRIGVDVGGTFTHGVAIGKARDVIAQARVPTTHAAEFGVAEGVLQVLKLLLETVPASEVELVAHSTTQATNSILEGDVSPIALVVISPQANLPLVRSLFRDKQIALGETSGIPLVTSFLSAADLPPDAKWMLDFESKLDSIPVFVIAESRGTDDPTGEYEEQVEFRFQSGGLLAGRHLVKASAISGRLGLKLRAITAAINGAMIPKVVQTARFTADAVSKLLPNRPLLVMKSDGGVMDAVEMEKSPLACVLSGPAAGASAAIHISKISDGIFLEIGGTSTDISLIIAGRVRKKSASLGGHVLHTRSLDLRTVGVGGGSLLWIDSKGSSRCGPRSAHILGLGYLSFPTGNLESSAENIAVSYGDEKQLVLEISGLKFGITLTDAANYLGIVPDGDVAFSTSPLINFGFEAVARYLNKKPQDIAQAMVRECRERVIAVVKSLVHDYHVSVEDLRLVTGGGGAGVITGEIARALKMRYEIAPYPAVISAVGAATAVSTFSIEVFCPEPNQDDFARLRNEASLKMGEMGVPPDQAKITFEFDSAQKILRVEAEGSIGFESFGDRLDEKELSVRAAELAGTTEDNAEIVYSEGLSAAVKCTRKPLRKFGRAKELLVCLDKFGRSQLVISGAVHKKTSEQNIDQSISSALSEFTVYGDGGETAPELFILTPTSLLDFSSFYSKHQIEAALTAMKDRISGSSLVIVRRRA